MTPQQIAAALAEPFPAAVVGWKAQAVKNNRCLAVPYIDARDVMDRLDAVVGIEGWQDEYTLLVDGNVMCKLSLCLDGSHWTDKSDVGGESEQPNGGDRMKAAFSDALKRAAVKWGIGRYLYRLDSIWADYDPARKQIVQAPALPAWALPRARPATHSPPEKQAAQAQASPPQPASGNTEPQTGEQLLARIRTHDAKLVAQGLCKPGALLAHVREWGHKAGLPAKIEDWRCPAPGYHFAIQAARDFEARLAPATTPQLEELDRQLMRKGRTVEQLRLALRLSPDHAGDLTGLQAARGLEWLAKLPDAPHMQEA